MGVGLLFTLLVILAEILGLLIVSLMVVLTNKYFGGYAWDGSEKQFNLHPILMVAGFLFFYGNSVLLYKIGAGISVSKFKIKMAHFLLHLLAFVCSVVGLVAVFQYHNAQGFGNARSLHSWMGLGTVVFYGSQLVLGFLFFLYPRPREEIRAAVKPVHVFFGIFLLGMICVSVLTGLTEKILFTDQGFDELSPVVIVTNIFAIAVVFFAGIVTYIVTSSKFSALTLSRYDQLN
ncbi:plasma membrane ascorbate-dependent reductase CYBRD1-like [Apostichopus japonicus]|uniref:plasma membrane ascorbate-dependent reductase CYBRD1-like n=1 Tax=Stichopus japonicus TaxID=307972 RepID=UPI003AB8850B